MRLHRREQAEGHWTAWDDGEPPTDPALLERLELHSTLDAALAEAREGLAQALSDALRELVREELALAPEHVRARALELLTRVRRARRAVLRVHPDDVSLLGDATHLAQDAERAAPVEVRADPCLERGECVVESSFGELHARFDAQIERLAGALRERL